MESVFVKGMKMPEGCHECILYCIHHEYIDGEWKAACGVTEEQGKDDGKRMEHCPLIPVGVPHGDLIDRDELPIVDLDSNMWLTEFGVPSEELKNAKVVIPAEV